MSAGILLKNFAPEIVKALTPVSVLQNTIGILFCSVLIVDGPFYEFRQYSLNVKAFLIVAEN